MNAQPTDRWEARLKELAAGLPYPPTPDLADSETRRMQAARPPFLARRRLPRAWTAVLALLLVAIALLLSIPSVRAQILEFIQLGAVRIWLVEPTPSNLATPFPPVNLDLSGKTTLADAAAAAGFPLRLPAYPTSLGDPAAVYFQDLNGPLVMLVWTDPQDTGKLRLTLQMIGPGSYAIDKIKPVVISHTQVNGLPALWTQGPYLLKYANGDLEAKRLIEGHVLVWAEGEITYRLETSLSMEEAVKIAESLEEH